MSRRRFLRALTVGAVGALSGCSFFADEPAPTPSETPTPSVGRTPARGRRKRTVPDVLERHYDTVHNVVQLGADHAGQRSVTGVLDSAVGNRTALYFPRGEYKLAEPLSVQGFRNVALVGNGALVRPPQGYADTLFEFGTDATSAGLRFEGIDFDLTAGETGARPIHAAIRDALLVRNVTVHGRQDVDQDSMRFDITGRNGSGRVEALRLPDGGSTAYPNTGIYVGEDSVGTLEFVDCHVTGFPDNGLYASPARGPVVVDGGTYTNNGIAGIRVSGASRINDVRIVCDTSRAGLENMRGIRLRGGSDILVRGSRIEMRNVTDSDGGITMAEWLENATIENSVVRTDANDIPGIRAKGPNEREIAGDPSSGYAITLRDVHVIGQAANDSAITIADRDGCQFERVCIQQRGLDRDGITLRNSTAAVLSETAVDVTGDPLVLDNARTKRREMQLGDFSLSCSR